jgi:hypothetical protein
MLSKVKVSLHDLMVSLMVVQARTSLGHWNKGLIQLKLQVVQSSTAQILIQTVGAQLC